MRFTQRLVDARHVTDPEGDGDTIETSVRVWQFLRIALLERNNAVEAPSGGTFMTDLEHVGVNIADDDTSAVTACVDDAEGDVTGAAGEIEHTEVPLSLWRVDRGHQRIFPRAMQATRHQVVHQVVAAGHRMKYVIDTPLLVLERHALIAEMSLVAARGHG